MAPRKRLRPNPAEGGSSVAPSMAPSETSAASLNSSVAARAPTPPIPAQPTDGSPRPLGEGNAPAPISNLPKQVHAARSWYGSWPRAPKSSASTHLARENILGGTLKTESAPDFTRFDTKKSTSSTGPDGGTGSAASLPNADETVGKTEDATEGSKMDIDAPPDRPEEAETEEGKDSVAVDAKSKSSADQEGTTPERPTTSSAWLGWFARTPASAPGLQNPPQAEGVIPTEPSLGETPALRHEEQQLATSRPAPEQATLPTAPATTWFDFWSSSDKNTASKASELPGPQITTEQTVKKLEDVTMQDVPQTSTSPTTPAQQPAGSTWAFWSRDTVQRPSGTSTPVQEQGELAVIGQGSEAHPEPATDVPVKNGKEPAKESKQKKKGDPTLTSTKKTKRLRPQSMEVDGPSSGKSTPEANSGTMPKPPHPSDPAKPDLTTGSTPAKATTPARVSPGRSLPPNLLLPSFSNTYHMKENPSILQQIAQLLLRTQQPPANHVFRVKEYPKIKKAISIGVHGLFPATFLRPMVGQPTGTSLRFASLGAEAIRRWADAHGCGGCEIEKVALEGEGRIADRVDNLWKLLLNWIDHLRSADLVILSCHSQGVPVGIMLIGKLIDLGIITDAKIGVCAMAGVSLGPFPDYKSGMGMLMGSAAELWEFANPASEMSRRYEVALKEALEYGVRITFVGSIDDQLVPMESAVHSPASHPYIYRAVFIDGRIHAPDFIAHLVGFALKLRNLGVSDHGLIRELSVPLAGSLYGGEGHSRLYYDEQIYDLAISHALETTDLPSKTPCTVRKHDSLAAPNPYHLPWVMRGLLEEDFVKTELSSETDELLKQYDAWKPVTKALKDVKYRLEAVRSRF